MPIYLNHDLVKNFTGSLDTGDFELTQDIFINEVTDLIVFNTQPLIDLLNKAGIKTASKDTDQALIEKILKNIGKNKTLQSGLAFLFADTNELINKDGVSKDQAKQTISQILGGITTVAQQITAKPALQDSLQISMLQQIETKAAAKGDYARTIYNKNSKSVRAKKGFAIFALVVITGTVLYIWYTHKHPKVTGPGLFPEPSVTPPATPTITDVAPANAVPAATPAVQATEITPAQPAATTTPAVDVPPPTPQIPPAQ